MSDERLDEETERLIGVLPQLAQSLTGHETVRILPLGEAIKRANAYNTAEDALRSRIRTLEETAVKDFAFFLETTASPKGTVQREKLQSFATEFLGALAIKANGS